MTATLEAILDRVSTTETFLRAQGQEAAADEVYALGLEIGCFHVESVDEPSGVKGHSQVPENFGETAVLVSLIVKGGSADFVEGQIAGRLNDWLNEPPHRTPFPIGALLSWCFYEPKVVNGR